MQINLKISHTAHQQTIYDSIFGQIAPFLLQLNCIFFRPLPL
jgi:hypothetical protein